MSEWGGFNTLQQPILNMASASQTMANKPLKRQVQINRKNIYCKKCYPHGFSQPSRLQSSHAVKRQERYRIWGACNPIHYQPKLQRSLSFPRETKEQKQQ
ncbi:hypothetical protein RTP6_003275 [Batrachochytrium dendrobatidis]